MLSLCPLTISQDDNMVVLSNAIYSLTFNLKKKKKRKGNYTAAGSVVPLLLFHSIHAWRTSKDLKLNKIDNPLTRTQGINQYYDLLPYLLKTYTHCSPFPRIEIENGE